MTLTCRLSLLIGAAATTAGLAVATGVLFGLELMDIFLELVVALAAFQGPRYAQRRRDAPPNTTATDDPEAQIPVLVPGTDFDNDLVLAMGQGTRWAARERVVDRPEMRAKEVLIASGGHVPEKAAALLKTGRWIDDPVTAYFLGASASTPLRQRVRLFLPGQSPLTDRVE